MALLKAIETDSGVNAVYWRIAITHVDHCACTAWAQVHGYASEETRRAGRAALDVKTESLDYDDVRDGGRGEFYAALVTRKTVVEDIPEEERQEGGPTTREVVISSPLFYEAEAV